MSINTRTYYYRKERKKGPAKRIIYLFFTFVSCFTFVVILIKHCNYVYNVLMMQSNIRANYIIGRKGRPDF